MGELGNEQRPDLPSNHNKRAHRVARLLTRRDADERATAVRDIVDGEAPKVGGHSSATMITDPEALQDCKDIMVTYHEIFSHYRKTPPHKQLERSQASDLRRLQTDTFEYPRHLNRLCPSLHPSPGCPWCGHETADMAHILWKCECGIRRHYPDEGVCTP